MHMNRMIRNETVSLSKFMMYVGLCDRLSVCVSLRARVLLLLLILVLYRYFAYILYYSRLNPHVDTLT
jgi:hypothetical protein